MARSRNIKPGFFLNDELAECGPLARLLFAGLWCIADREGRLQDRPKRIKAEVLPHDNCDADDLLKQLETAGFIVRYQAGNDRYIQVCNFGKHQNPHVKESPSTIPAPDEHSTSTVQEQCKTDESTEQTVLIPDSLNLIPDSGFQEKKRARKPRATPLPEGFDVSERVRQWAKEKGFDRLDEHLEHFLGYARANGPTYVDWDEALMNAVRKDWAGVRKSAPAARRTPAPENFNEVDYGPGGLI